MSPVCIHGNDVAVRARACKAILEALLHLEPVRRQNDFAPKRIPKWVDRIFCDRSRGTRNEPAAEIGPVTGVLVPFVDRAAFVLPPGAHIDDRLA